MGKKLLIKRPAGSGYQRVFGLGEYEMKLTEYGILSLGSGESYKGETGEMELALVLLGGKFRIYGEGFDFTVDNGRADVFSGKSHTVYLPRRRAYKVEARAALELALCFSPAERDSAKPSLITPEMTRELRIGRDNFSREATVMIDEKFDSCHFYIGEGMVPSGNWSGYPPHRHDYDNLPDEIDMEETYFYRFDPAQGFGIQKVYTGDGEIDETYTIKTDDTVAIARGYHPLVAAPGYRMYYLWMMCGPVNRNLISSKDPEHAWVK